MPNPNKNSKVGDVYIHEDGATTREVIQIDSIENRVSEKWCCRYKVKKDSCSYRIIDGMKICSADKE